MTSPIDGIIVRQIVEEHIQIGIETMLGACGNSGQESIVVMYADAYTEFLEEEGERWLEETNDVAEAEAPDEDRYNAILGSNAPDGAAYEGTEVIRAYGFEVVMEAYDECIAVIKNSFHD